jgi:DNA-binding NarL/FixJ family response regulator
MNTTGHPANKNQVEPEMRSETREAARVLIADDNQLRASSIAAVLKGSSDITVIVTAPDGRTIGHELPADLVLLALGGRQAAALATGALAVQRNPFAEVVFYGDDPAAPEVAAAAVLGITRIVHARDLLPWLARSGDLLARGAMLRRIAAAALAAVPRPPTLSLSTERSNALPLPTAEMQFRESYIRYLLAESGSRQEAARRAGVPYRTMCEMIRKLDISAE